MHTVKQLYSHEDVDLHLAFSLVYTIVDQNESIHQGASAASRCPGNGGRALLGHIA